MAALSTAVSARQTVSPLTSTQSLLTLGDNLPEPTAQKNYHHLVQDVVFFGLGSAALARFLSVFAIRLGATPTELSLIAALPALALLIGATFGVRWMRHFATSRDAHRLPSIIYRLCFVLPLFALFMPTRWQPAWIIAAVSVPALMQGLAGVSFTCMFRDAVRSSSVTRLLSVRSMMVNVTQAVSAIGFGVMLQHVLFPLNYAVMFIAAWVFQCVSDFHCASVRVLPQLHQNTSADSTHTQSPWRSMGFRQVALVVVITQIAFLSVNAILPLYLVRKLGAEEGFIALFGLIELAAGVGISFLMPRIIGRIGYRTAIAWAMAGTAVGALIIALAPSLAFTLIGAAVGGASWTAASAVGLFGFLNENTPPHAMAAYSTSYHQIVGLAAFIGPMIGGLLANAHTNLVSTLLVGVALRFLAAPLVEFSGLFISGHMPHLHLARR